MLVGDFEKTDVSILFKVPTHRSFLMVPPGAQDEACVLVLVSQQRGQQRRPAGFQVRGLHYPMLALSNLHVPSMMYFVPLAVLGAYFAWRYYSSGSI